LEVQTSDKLGWFISRDPSSAASEEVEIQTLTDLIQEVTTTELIRDHSSGNTLYKILPPSIRSFIRPLSIVKKWATSLIVEPGIGIARRQARMKFFLNCIELCRPAPNAKTPGVTSFVEAALTAALLSPASRAFQRAWFGLAQDRGCAVDSLESFLFVPSTRERVSGLRTDVGWVLERMMEVLCLPDTFESETADKPAPLINFSKRRYLCELAAGTPTKIQQEGYQRLSNMHDVVARLTIDLRSVLPEAVRENGPAWAQTQRKLPRPFQKLVVLQQERLKRDKHMRDRMLKEYKADQQRNREREQMLENATPRKAPVQFSSPVSKAQRSKRTMSSAFLRVMRPLSTAFLLSEPSHPSGHRSTTPLDFPETSPAMVISIVGAKLAMYMNLERPHTFQLDTEESHAYLFQATSKAEMNQWLSQISKVAQTAASKRLTFISDLKPQASEHALQRPRTITRHPVAVFGVGLEFLLKRENGEDVPPDTIPSVLEKCFAEVERKGLQEVGICEFHQCLISLEDANGDRVDRVGGQTSVTNGLKEGFDSGKKGFRV
jgi:hypothetical protein